MTKENVPWKLGLICRWWIVPTQNTLFMYKQLLSVQMVSIISPCVFPRKISFYPLFTEKSGDHLALRLLYFIWQHMGWHSTLAIVAHRVCFRQFWSRAKKPFIKSIVFLTSCIWASHFASNKKTSVKKSQPVVMRTFLRVLTLFSLGKLHKIQITAISHKAVSLGI